LQAHGFMGDGEGDAGTGSTEEPRLPDAEY
jgi:hypothetical protein